MDDDLLKRIRQATVGRLQQITQNITQRPLASPIPQQPPRTGSFQYNVNRLATQALTPVANFQRFIQGPGSFDLPNLNPNPKLPTPKVGSLGYNTLDLLARVQPAAQLVRDLANEPFSYTTNAAADVGKLIVGGFKGSPELLDYRNLKSPATRLGYNLMGAINPSLRGSYNITNPPQQFIGNAAGTIKGPLSVYGGGAVLGAGRTALTQIPKQGILKTANTQGVNFAKLSGVYGLTDALEKNRDNTLLNQLTAGVKQGAESAVVGYGLGATLGAGGAVISKFFVRDPQVVTKLEKKAVKLDQQPRKPNGEYATKTLVKPKGMTNDQWNFQLKINKALGRNPYTVVYPSDVAKLAPQPGMSIKYTQKPQGLKVGGAASLPEEELISEMIGMETPNFSNQPGTFNAAPTPQTLAKIKLKNSQSQAKQAKADFEEWQKQVFTQENATQTTNKAMKQAVGEVKSASKSPLANPEELKDISGFYAGWRDVYRNFKAVYGKGFDKVKQVVLDPFDSAKGKFFGEQDVWADKLEKEVVNKLGINKGSPESGAVQEFGEGLIDYQTLVQRFGQKKAKNIVAADKWFRGAYDQLLDEVNRVRQAIYPNQPDKIIPKRKDYYRHFREVAEGYKGLFNIFETPAGISSGLSGKSEFVKPKSKFLSFAQKRLGMQTDVDAVGGFIDYLKSAAYAKNIDPQIGRFRALAEELAANTAEGPNAGKLNNFIEFLNDFANDLSGKTNPFDRTTQKWIPGGRKTFAVLNWLNSRVKANTILGNLSSTLAQAANIPQGIASAGPINASKGLGRSLAGMFNPNNPTKKSIFLKERYFNAYDRFDKGLLNDTKKFTVWMTQVLDEVGTKYIWNSHYAKALSENIPNPVKYADDATRSLVGGRGIGEVPLIQKSKLFQIGAPFQLEVANLWHVMGDMVGEKKFGALATLFLMNYIFNRGVEQVRGSGVTFDPIQATIEALGELDGEDDQYLRAGGRLTGEVLTNLPVGQTGAAIYPEYGGTVGDVQFPTRKEFFGRSDPTRFGGGLLVAKGLQDPLFKVLPPYGGGQIQKSWEGLSTITRGYSETDSGRVRFPVEQTPGNLIRGALFGQYATPEAREYFKQERRPLGDEQSMEFKLVSNREKFYKDVLDNRARENIKEAIKEGGSSSAGRYSDLSLVFELDKLGQSPTEPVARAKWEKKAYDKARDIINDDKYGLSSDEKTRLIAEMGLDHKMVEYFDTASQDNTIKTVYVRETITNTKDRGQVLRDLAFLRGEVRGERVLTNGVIDNLMDEGVLSGEEGQILKKIDFSYINQDGRMVPKLKITGRGRGAKIKAVKFVPLNALKGVKKGSLPNIAGISSLSTPQPQFSVPNIRVDNTPTVTQPGYKVRFNL